SARPVRPPSQEHLWSACWADRRPVECLELQFDLIIGGYTDRSETWDGDVATVFDIGSKWLAGLKHVEVVAVIRYFLIGPRRNSVLWTGYTNNRNNQRRRILREQIVPYTL